MGGEVSARLLMGQLERHPRLLPALVEARPAIGSRTPTACSEPGVIMQSFAFARQSQAGLALASDSPYADEGDVAGPGAGNRRVAIDDLPPSQRIDMRFPGIIPAVTTPFQSDDTIDTAALRSNVESLLAAGVHGVVATGTMGESASLDLNERREVITAIAEAIDGRVPLLAGIAAPTAKIATRYGLAARDSGATALMMLPPLNYNGDLREIASFYRTVGETVGLPVMAYNNPVASGVDLSVHAIATLAEEVESVVAIKECSGDARAIAGIIGAAPENFEVLIGGDDWALEGFCAGGTGWVSGVANVVPAECVALYEACRAGDLATAQSLYQRLLPLGRLDMTPKLVQYYKAGMDESGLVGGPAREPRLPLTEEEQQILAAAMRSVQPARVS
jgi:4-hydroxy-tetrahydrodipicolinate synthase